MKNIGLVLVQPGPRVAYEPLISGIEHGLEETFVKSGMCLVTRVVHGRDAELEVYRYWHQTEAVDAVILVQLRPADDRVRLLTQLRIPFAAVVDAGQVNGYSAVTIDSASMMREAVSYLTSRGRTDIVYVKAPVDTVIAEVRARTIQQEADAAGARGRVVDAELTEEAAQEVTRELMADPVGRPRAVVFDDDVTAVAGLETIRSLGLAVPEDVAVLAWNDSVRCQSATPPITAMSDQAHQIGLLAAGCLIRAVETGKRIVVNAPDSFVVQRASA